MARLAAVLVVLALVVSPVLAQEEGEKSWGGDRKAEELVGAFGVGFNAQTIGLWMWGESSFAPYSAALSVRYYFMNMVGMEVSLGFGWFSTEQTEQDGEDVKYSTEQGGEDVKYSALELEPKVLVNFMSDEQTILYAFGGLGLLRYKYPKSIKRGDVDYDTDTGVRLSGGLGMHWFFYGLPNLGFSAELGIMYETAGDDEYLGTFGGMLANFGIHYYFSF